MREFQADTAGEGLCNGQELTLLQRRKFSGACGKGLDAVNTRILMYKCWLTVPGSDEKNLRRLRTLGSWIEMTLYNLVATSCDYSSMVSFFIFAEPALPGAERAVRQGQRSQGVSGAAPQHGPADPGIGST